MKILHINCVYEKGSTGRIVCAVHNGLLNSGNESVICYGRGDAAGNAAYKVCPEWYAKMNNAWSRLTGMMYGGCFFSTNRLLDIIRREHPDIVHIHCINGYFVNIPQLITFLKIHHIKTVVTLHAEFMYTANCSHARDCEKWKTECKNCPRFRQETKSLFFDRTSASFRKMKKAFDGFDEELVVVSVSDWLKKRAEQSAVLRGKTHLTILNGLDTTVFHPCDTQALRQQYNPSGKKVVLHVTPMFNTKADHAKGGRYIIELAQKMCTQQVLFLVAGKYDLQEPVPKNVILLGEVKDPHKLAQLYSLADITLLTSSRETFSMVTAESLCCGTPVVGFKAGAPEEIAIQEYTEFVDYGKIESLYKAVQSWLIQENDRQQISSEACRKYDVSAMVNAYLELYQKL